MLAFRRGGVNGGGRNVDLAIEESSSLPSTFKGGVFVSELLEESVIILSLSFSVSSAVTALWLRRLAWKAENDEARGCILASDTYPPFCRRLGRRNLWNRLSSIVELGVLGFDEDGRAKSEDDVGRGGRDDALGIIHRRIAVGCATGE